MLSSAPVLPRANYSRDLETESAFDSILCRIGGGDKESDGMGFLASHPATRERAHCEKPAGQADLNRL